MVRRLVYRTLGRLMPQGRTGTAGDSLYDDRKAVRHAVRIGKHRDVIGGLWEEVGQLQLSYLQDSGLKPEHRLLDIGCGSLRAGVHLIPWLAPGHYWGIDINAALLEAGWTRELVPAGLDRRQPREQLVCLGDFEIASLGVRFDVALATSVFTHLTFNRIRRCLTRLAPAMERGGVFHASFFEVGPDQDRDGPIVQEPGGIISHACQDPFHYSQADVAYMCTGLPWRLDWVGSWGHPRNQKMARFVRL